MSHKLHPIKVVDTAPSETTDADEIAIETAKTGKVTAVVTVMSIFSRKSLRYEKPSCQKAERANFPEENTCGSRSQKSRKGQIPKKLASKLKKLASKLH